MRLLGICFFFLLPLQPTNPTVSWRLVRVEKRVQALEQWRNIHTSSDQTWAEVGQASESLEIMVKLRQKIRDLEGRVSELEVGEQ